MPNIPAPGSTVTVKSGPYRGKTGTVRRVRTDAQVVITLPNGREIHVELYHLND